MRLTLAIGIGVALLAATATGCGNSATGSGAGKDTFSTNSASARAVAANSRDSATGCNIGEIRAFASPQLPTGYLPANGQIVAQASYPALARMLPTPSGNDSLEPAAPLTLPDMTNLPLLNPGGTPLTTATGANGSTWGVCVGTATTPAVSAAETTIACPADGSLLLLPQRITSLATTSAPDAAPTTPTGYAWMSCAGATVGAPLGSLIPLDRPGGDGWLPANGAEITAAADAPLSRTVDNRFGGQLPASLAMPSIALGPATVQWYVAASGGGNRMTMW